MSLLPTILMLAAVLANSFVSYRYLKVFVARYAQVPSTFGWVLTADADGNVELWRRWRVATSVFAIVALFVFITTF